MWNTRIIVKKYILAALTGGDLEYPDEGEPNFSHLSEYYFLFFNLDRHVHLSIANFSTCLSPPSILREVNLFKSVLVILKVRLAGILLWGWFGFHLLAPVVLKWSFSIIYIQPGVIRTLESESENLGIAMTINEIIFVKCLWKCDILFFDL